MKKSRKRGGKSVRLDSAVHQTPSTQAAGLNHQRLFDALSPASRATLAAVAVPGAPAEALNLAAGATLSERMRTPSLLGASTEADWPNIREAESRAPTLWAKHREQRAKWRLELEGKISDCRPAFVQGNLGALLDALIHCAHRDDCLFGILSKHGEHWVELPRWAVDALSVLAAEIIPMIRGQATGQHARWLRSWKQDQTDFARWKAVKELREHKIPFTDGRVYEEAARYLDEAFGGGSDSVRRSYLRVQKRMKSQPGRYISLDYVRAMNPKGSLP